VFSEPLVSLYSVEIAGISFIGTQLLCRIQVDNPNAFDIPFPEVGWEFFINTNSFISGVIRNNQRIRARNSTYVEVPVNLDYLEIFNTFTSFKGRKDVDYRIALAVKFAIPVLGDKYWHIEHEDVVPLPQAPVISMPAMRVDRADLSGVHIVASVNVENPNIFPLPPPNIAYDFLVNRNSFISSTIESGPLAASSVTPIVYRLDVNYADLFRNFSALQLLGSAQSLFNMEFDFGIPAFAGEIVSLQIPGTLPLR